jgi:hypothetical protein
MLSEHAACESNIASQGLDKSEDVRLMQVFFSRVALPKRRRAASRASSLDSPSCNLLSSSIAR